MRVQTNHKTQAAGILIKAVRFPRLTRLPCWLMRLKKLC